MDKRLQLLRDKDYLVRNLCFLQKLIVASAPLLDFAIDYSQGGLRAYYEQHLEEEEGHDEMLEGDLQRLGVDSIPVCYTAATIAGSQYYLVAHEHPAMLLGYMFVLESNPIPLSAVTELEKFYGVWLDSFRHHSQHDAAHAADVTRMIEKCSPQLQTMIWDNARIVKRSLDGVGKKLLEKVEVS